MKNSNITITRTNQYVNRYRKITIYIDGQLLGKISNGETKTFSVNEGQHNLKAKIDWCTSQPLNIHTSPEITNNIELGSPLKFRKREFLYGFLQLLLLYGSIFSIKLRGNDSIFWIGMSILLLWFLGDFILSKKRSVLYYITIGSNKYLYLKEMES